MSSRWEAEKHQVALAAKKMAGLGLVTGSSGNVSLRIAAPHPNSEGLLAVTPSGVSYETLNDDDIVITDFDIESVEGDLVPSSESLLHSAIYRARPDVGAVIHTHSVYCSAAAVSVTEIPAIIDEMVILAGGPIRVSKYAFPGTQDLADNVCSALDGRSAAIIRNHGAVGVGRDLDEALAVCALVERVAQVFVYATLLGKVTPLPEEVVEAEVAVYKMRRDRRRQ